MCTLHPTECLPKRMVLVNLNDTSYHILYRYKVNFKTYVLMNHIINTVVLIRDQTRSVAKQVSVAVGWVKIEISLMAQLKGLTAKFKLM